MTAKTGRWLNTQPHGDVGESASSRAPITSPAIVKKTDPNTMSTKAMTTTATSPDPARPGLFTSPWARSRPANSRAAPGATGSTSAPASKG